MTSAKKTPAKAARTSAAAAPPAAEDVTTTVTGASITEVVTGEGTTAESVQASTSPEAAAGDQQIAATAQGGDAAAESTAAPDAPAAPDAEREYLVGTVPVRHKGRVYGVGYSIWLTDAHAKRLDGLVTLIPEAPKED